jgi:hypothetical protein
VLSNRPWSLGSKIGPATSVGSLIDRLDRLLVGSTGKLCSSTMILPTTRPNTCGTSAPIDASAASADSADVV